MPFLSASAKNLSTKTHHISLPTSRASCTAIVFGALQRQRFRCSLTVLAIQLALPLIFSLHCIRMCLCRWLLQSDIIQQMRKQSAGLLVYRTQNGKPEVLLAHVGGPWFAKKDAGAWSIPKGEIEEGEDPQSVARREFNEELGKKVPEGEPVELGVITQKNNKDVTAWALEGDLDVSSITSNTVEIEWPPRSGKKQRYPEIDRAGWFSLEEASTKLIPAQVAFLERLAEKLGIVIEPASEPEQGELKLE